MARELEVPCAGVSPLLFSRPNLCRGWFIQAVARKTGMGCLTSSLIPSHDLTHDSNAGSVTKPALPDDSGAATACRSLAIVFADTAFSVTLWSVPASYFPFVHETRATSTSPYVAFISLYSALTCLTEFIISETFARTLLKFGRKICILCPYY